MKMCLLLKNCDFPASHVSFRDGGGKISASFVWFGDLCEKSWSKMSDFMGCEDSLSWGCWDFTPRKLTWQWKITICLKEIHLHSWLVFHCHLSFWGCTSPQGNSPLWWVGVFGSEEVVICGDLDQLRFFSSTLERPSNSSLWVHLFPKIGSTVRRMPVGVPNNLKETVCVFLAWWNIHIGRDKSDRSCIVGFSQVFWRNSQIIWEKKWDMSWVQSFPCPDFSTVSLGPGS